MKTMTAEEFSADMDTIAGTFGGFVGEALKDCEPIVADAILENFARQQSPDGEEWPERKKIGDGHPLLVETKREGSGSLLAAATGQGAGNVCRIEGDTLVWGVDKDGGIGGIPGAGIHNTPVGESSFNNIPGREFLGIDEDHADQCGEIFANQGMQWLQHSS